MAKCSIINSTRQTVLSPIKKSDVKPFSYDSRPPIPALEAKVVDVALRQFVILFNGLYWISLECLQSNCLVACGSFRCLRRSSLICLKAVCRISVAQRSHGLHFSDYQQSNLRHCCERTSTCEIPVQSRIQSKVDNVPKVNFQQLKILKSRGNQQNLVQSWGFVLAVIVQAHVAFDLASVLRSFFTELCRHAEFIRTCKAWKTVNWRNVKTKRIAEKMFFMFRNTKSKHHRRKFPISTRISASIFAESLHEWEWILKWNDLVIYGTAEGCKQSTHRDSHHDQWWNFHGKLFKSQSSSVDLCIERNSADEKREADI